MPGSMFKLTPMRSDRVLLTTSTGEPFQPVRLYYALPAKPLVTRVLLGLRCMQEDAKGGRWNWLYEAEAEALTFDRPRAELPPEVHPVIIGVLRFPKKGGLILEVRSSERAIVAAKFFAPLFGPRVVLERARVVNRFFEGTELALRLRNIRAYEHFNGNTTLTLRDIIYRMAEQGALNAPPA
jgi:hypothetical protein